MYMWTSFMQTHGETVCLSSSSDLGRLTSHVNISMWATLLPTQSSCHSHPSMGTYPTAPFLTREVHVDITEYCVDPLTEHKHGVIGFSHVCVLVGVLHEGLVWPFKDVDTTHTYTHTHTCTHITCHFACMRVHPWIMNPKYQRRTQETRYTVHTHCPVCECVFHHDLSLCIHYYVFWKSFRYVFVCNPDSHSIFPPLLCFTSVGTLKCVYCLRSHYDCVCTSWLSLTC